MIQRIQTVYLFLNVIFYTIILFTPIASIGDSYVLNVWMLKDTNGTVLAQTFYLGLTAVTIILISIFCIFSYKNRLTQNKLCVSLFVLIMLFIGLLFFIYPEFLIKKFVSESTAIKYSVWTILSVIPLASTMFANKAILKDEKKVRESDRLR